MAKTITKKSIKDKQIPEDMKQLAIARMMVIPKDFQISVGGESNLSRDEIIKNIENNSRVGKEMVDVQIEFLRDMAQGKIYNYE